MAKIIEVNNFDKFIKRAEIALLKHNMDLVHKNLVHAKNVAKSKEEKIEVSLKMAKIYAGEGRLYFSNQRLFEVLSYVDSDEAKSLLMFNFLALGQTDTAKYYYDQIRDYLKTQQNEKFILVKHTFQDNKETKEDLNIDSFMQEIFTASEKDELNEESSEELKNFAQSIVKDDIEMDMMEICNEKANTFTVHSRNTKYKRKLNELFECIANENFEKAVNIFESLDLDKAPDFEKSSLYYGRAICYLFAKDYENAINYCDKAIEINNVNEEFIFLKIEALAKLKRYKEVGENLDGLKDFIPHDNNQFKHFMYVLMNSEHWDFAIDYLNRHLKQLRSFYLPEEILGIFYFNSGKYEEAKKTFIKLYSRYGDLTHAKHYLYYIKNRVLDGIPLDAIFGDWPKMTLVYVKYFYNLVDLTDLEFTKKVIYEKEDILNAVSWLAQWPSAPALLETIERIHFLSYGGSKKYRNKLSKIREEIFKIIFTMPFIKDEIKLDVLCIAFLTSDHKTFSIVNEGEFFNVTGYLPEDIDVNFVKAAALAKAIAVRDGYYTYLEFEKQIADIVKIYNEKAFYWRSSEAACAVIVEDFLGLKMKDVAPIVKYTKAIKNKYSNQLLDSFLNNNNKL